MPADPSLNYLVRSLQQSLRDRQPERLRRLKVDDQLELGGLLDGQIRRLRPLVHKYSCATEHIVKVRSIRCRASGGHKVPLLARHWVARLESKGRHCGSVGVEEGRGRLHYDLSVPALGRLKRLLDGAGDLSPHLKDLQLQLQYPGRLLRGFQYARRATSGRIRVVEDSHPGYLGTNLLQQLQPFRDHTLQARAS